MYMSKRKQTTCRYHDSTARNMLSAATHMGTSPLRRAGTRQRLGRRASIPLLVLLVLAALSPSQSAAQSRVGSDSATRTTRYWRDLAFGTALGAGWALVDQQRNDPPEWGRGWHGYERRLASDVGEFVIQESVTHVLAAMLNRPLDYQPCPCRRVSRRLGWALQAAVTDPMPQGTHPIAIPRIVGAYAGSFAQAIWRPATSSSRTRTALVNGTVSLFIGAGINVFKELRR
jgi:hypothetical protein